jgi:hypothetical protein
LIVKERVPERGVPAVESFTVITAVPVAFGVPPRTPVVVLKDIPAGRLTTERMYGGVPPLALTVAGVYGTLTVPFSSDAGEITIGGLMVRDRVPIKGVGLVESLTVITALPDADGVPLSTPVETLNDIPAGSPETERT